MVGLVDPNPAQPKAPEKQPESWWSSAFTTNPVRVMRPAKGRLSPKTDERCITWCSQTVRGRTEGQDPWCRSICIRRVFEHEVRQLTSHFSHDSAYHSRSSAGKSNEPVLKYPLPPEGQPSHPEDDPDSDFASSSTSAYPYSHSLARDQSPAGPETRYWQEGWYIWMTKNRWAAQEKIDLMMFDLEKQTQWQKSKDQDVRAWAIEDEERRRARVGVTGVGEPTAEEREEQEREDELFRTTYLNAAEESFLVRVPTRIPIGMYAQQTIAPTWKVLGIVRESFASGAQQDLARRAWDVTLEGAPFRLVKNVFKTCIESFKGGSNGDSQP